MRFSRVLIVLIGLIVALTAYSFWNPDNYVVLRPIGTLPGIAIDLMVIPFLLTAIIALRHRPFGRAEWTAVLSLNIFTLLACCFLGASLISATGDLRPPVAESKVLATQGIYEVVWQKQPTQFWFVPKYRETLIIRTNEGLLSREPNTPLAECGQMVALHVTFTGPGELNIDEITVHFDERTLKPARTVTELCSS